VKRQDDKDRTAAVETARQVLRALLRRGSISLDEIGRRMGHTRGYMSRALRGLNPLTLETIIESLDIAGVDRAEYFADVAKALAAPGRAKDSGPFQAEIEETVLRTLRRLGWTPPEDSGKSSRR
jgi:transcriptional regulator with XRE-family HTH domain